MPYMALLVNATRLAFASASHLLQWTAHAAATACLPGIVVVCDLLQAALL